jgi:hypothetical protein
MPEPLGPQPIGTSRVYRITLAGAEGSSLAGHFDGTETFTARLWPGGSYPTAATLSAAWEAAPAALARPVLLLTVSAAAIADLDPVVYQLEVLADPDELLYRGSLRLEASPGAVALPRVYCTLADLLAECSWVERVEELKDARAANFLPEIAQASRWVEDQAMARWRRANVDQARRHGPVLCVAPIVVTEGVDAGPWWGDSAIPDTTLRTAEDAFAALLDSAGLMQGHPADRGKLARVVALEALALSLDDQVGPVPGTETTMQAMAGQYRKRRARLMPGLVLRVDSDADGVADYTLAY